MAAGDSVYDEDKMRIRIDCLGCVYGSSIEDYEQCMAQVIDKILENKKVRSVVLAKDREYEYDYEQVRMLVEVASLIEEVVREKLISRRNLGPEECERCYPDRSGRLQRVVLDTLRKDPVGAYVDVIRQMREVNVRLKETTSRKCYECLVHYRDSVLGVLKARMEGLRLVQAAKPHLSGYHIGDRSLYRQLFMPVVRPNFMLTRYMLAPPEGGRSVQKYRIGDTQVEVFRMPESTSYFYHITPAEFMLPEEKYAVLDAARRYMASHRPKTAEFVRSKNVRDVFHSIGKDMIQEMADHMGVHLSTREAEQLAAILTRYTAGLGVLELLLADERIQDIYLNSPVENQSIMIYHQDWEECKTNLIPSSQDAESWATRLRIESGRPLDEANPVLDADILVPGGYARFCVITRTLSPHGLSFSIRRHRDKPWTLPLFIKAKMLTPEAAGLLSFLIDGSVSLLVAGGRGAGKTSVLGSLMLELLPNVRVVSLEDTLELPIEQMRELKYNIERLKTRSVITRVETEMPADEALRTALRLGDSALIIGEIRSVEARALYEAMRVGALSNVVAGTIHGESAYGVYDRVVNDLGVPKTSFKATDIIPICKSLRSADGLHRFRRMTEITEVRKRWEDSPEKEGGFVNLMQYSGKEDVLKPTDTLLNGESEVLNRIASYVKEWNDNWEVVWDNIMLRAKMKGTLVELADKTARPDILEAEWVVRSNQTFHLIQDTLRRERGAAEAKDIYEKWLAWLKPGLAGKG
jgi:flagellar protein FlaI